MVLVSKQDQCDTPHAYNIFRINIYIRIISNSCKRVCNVTTHTHTHTHTRTIAWNSLSSTQYNCILKYFLNNEQL